MRSYFHLELDTTPPVIEIHTPQYVLNGHYFEFRVTANEPIDIGRFEAKAIDNANNEYNIILNKIDDEFSGMIDTYGFVNGIAKIQITLYDLVHNSTTTEKVFKILTNDIHKIDILFKSYQNKINKISRNNVIRIIKRINCVRMKKHNPNIFILKRQSKLTYKVGDKIVYRKG